VALERIVLGRSLVACASAMWRREREHP
jgi:hypothetical protein